MSISRDLAGTSFDVGDRRMARRFQHPQLATGKFLPVRISHRADADKLEERSLRRPVQTNTGYLQPPIKRCRPFLRRLIGLAQAPPAISYVGNVGCSAGAFAFRRATPNTLVAACSRNRDRSGPLTDGRSPYNGNSQVIGGLADLIINSGSMYLASGHSS